MKKTDLRQQAEAKLTKSKKGKTPAPATDADTQRLVHELQVHQVELEMQNEELVQSRAEAEEKHRQYTDLYDFAPVGYFTLARDGTIKQVNLGGASLLGAERSKLIKRRFGVFVSVGSRPVFSGFLEKVFINGSKETCEITLLKEGTDPLWVRIEATTVDEQREACRAIVMDITERKQSEDALRESQELFAQFMQHSPIYTFIKRVSPTESRVLQASDNYQQMIGIPGRDMAGKTMQELFPAELAAKFTADDWAVVSSGQVLILDEDLNGRHYTTIKFPIVKGDKTLLAGYTIDITERKQAEEEFHQLNANLEQRVEERTRELREAQEQLVRHEKLAVMGQLAGSVGHELRNPLGVINSAVYYLKLIQPDADAKIKEYLGIIGQEVRTSEKIITDLLDFARAESVEQEAVSVSDLIRQALERFPARPTVEVTLKIPNDLPMVFVDSRQMTQVLGNLVINACQAMEDGGQLIVSSDQLSVNGNTSTSLSSGQWVRIAVKDTGIGIPPENISKLFEPLFTTKTKGIGLGLAVSKKLAEANGGRIEVESEPGKGSTFTVWLPVKQS
jgi:PAS domain S-box-containing protein